MAEICDLLTNERLKEIGSIVLWRQEIDPSIESSLRNALSKLLNRIKVGKKPEMEKLHKRLLSILCCIGRLKVQLGRDQKVKVIFDLNKCKSIHLGLVEVQVTGTDNFSVCINEMGFKIYDIKPVRIPNQDRMSSYQVVGYIPYLDQSTTQGDCEYLRLFQGTPPFSYEPFMINSRYFEILIPLEAIWNIILLN